MQVNALQQYIDLYRDNKALIEDNSASLLNSFREDAFSRLSATHLPAKGSEDYELSDLDGMLAPDYGLNLSRLPLGFDPALSFRCDVPNLSTSLFMLLNDSWAETEISRRALPDGVIVCPLRKAAEEYPDLVAKYYGRAADGDNPLVALNTMLVQDGFFMYVPKGVKLEKPVQLVNIFAGGIPMMAVRRMLIVIDDDAEARLLVCDHTQNEEQDFLSLQTIEIFAGERASFDIYDLEESTRRTSRLSTLYLRQAERSNVLVDGITLFNGTTRNEYHCTFDGRHCELRLLGMAIEDEQRHIDNYTMIRHNTPDCHSNELFKYVVDDEAKGAFAGRIYVADGAVKTEAYQSNRNLVGSDKARMMSKPQLEIYNDDVKCSHGSATGQLDPMQLFYMRTRGLSEETARLLLKQAFMADVIEGVRMPMVRDRLRLLVERRLSGEKKLCQDCNEECPAHDTITL